MRYLNFDLFKNGNLMKHGARNDLVGNVIELNTSGGVMAQAKVKLDGEFTISSVMTKESLESLGISEGDSCLLYTSPSPRD